MSFFTIRWHEGQVELLDQTQLPAETVYVRCTTPDEVADAIRRMLIRGAPAIGIAAAMGIALAATRSSASDLGALRSDIDAAARLMAGTRPTAVNLFWAIERMRTAAAADASSPAALRERLVAESQAVLDEDVAINRAIGQHGAELLPDPCVVLTHCNAGALATGGYGTALGVIRAAHERGMDIQVLADETRPYLQGARLTAWELHEDRIPVTVITDNMAGHFLAQGAVDAVVVGADRVAANGDVANKIGTYSVAVLARENGIPFYVAAPVSTFDPDTDNGDDIPIEERTADEVLAIGKRRLAPAGVGARHPAFDVTPHRYITGIITEQGVLRPPYRERIRNLDR